MQQGSGGRRARKWFDSAPASLCVLGAHLRARGFFQPLEQAVRIRQKVLKYTPAQKLELLFGSLLAGAKAVSHTGTTLRVDPALQAAFGRPGCADQSVLADTPDAATEPDVAARRRAVETLLGRYSHTRHHAFARAVLVLGLDLSPLPASPRAEGSERCCMGRRRSRTGRKLVRVRAAASQETVWEDVRSGRTVETLALLQQAVAAAERLPGLEGDSPAVAAKRARAERRLDSAWGSEADFNWLLGRGYQVTAEFRSTARVQKLVAPITAWQPTASAGREVAPGPAPVAFGRPTRQYAVRTPSAEKPGGFYHAVLCTSRSGPAMPAVVAPYDARAGREADPKGDKHGLGLAVTRQRKPAAQQLVVLLVGLAHTVLVRARRWLAQRAPRLATLGIVRLGREVRAVPGRVRLAGGRLQRVRLRPEHPRAREVYRGLRPLLAPGQTLGLLG